MTTTSELEVQLAARFGEYVKGFFTALQAQGHLVEAGDAAVLKRLRTQVGARRSLPEAYQAAVDTIVAECGYPSEVAVRVATALRRKGLLGDDGEPQLEPAPGPGPVPLSPAARGAVVLPVAPRLERAVVQRLTVERVSGQAPEVRPAAARQTNPRVEGTAGWEAACAHAVTVAATLQLQHAGRLDLTEIAPDRDRVTVVIRAHSLRDWEYWLDAIGAPPNVSTRTVENAQLAAGQINGAPVHLTAHDVPRLLHEAEQAAREPFYLWGRMYDLNRGQVDQHGNTWLFLGHRQDGGMPLLLLRGTDGPVYPLGSIVMGNGPLTPTDAAHAAAVPQGARGEK
ncbi:BN159_2729 family protein [Streptomyces prunicolor]|uniref:BN159_2729 family protein n=1 Tax=Streptomyces prunicolor TaxID=67348 RepID=UPI0022550E1F|nr:BN159_2729 family protein [Streptomyces prunicolor]MCX5239729.1 BN159_2729 family protein [Streptomyces prunicolor]